MGGRHKPETLRAWKEANTDKIRAYTKAYRSVRKDIYREYALLSKYGVSLVQFQQMYDAQDGLCAICDRKMRLAGRNGHDKACIDHDHKSGVLRGLLCSKCNMTLGLVDDNTDTLMRAIGYLQRNKQ